MCRPELKQDETHWNAGKIEIADEVFFQKSLEVSLLRFRTKAGPVFKHERHMHMPLDFLNGFVASLQAETRAKDDMALNYLFPSLLDNRCFQGCPQVTNDLLDIHSGPGE